MPRYAYSFGKQNIIKDKMLYDSGVDFNCLAPVLYFFHNIKEGKEGTMTNKNIAWFRAVTRDAFVLRFGFTYLF